MFSRDFLSSVVQSIGQWLRQARLKQQIYGATPNSNPIELGTSKRTVAQDKRASARNKARRRARKLGHA